MNDEFIVHEVPEFTLYQVMTRGDREAVVKLLSDRLALELPLIPNTTSTSSLGLKAAWFGPAG